MSTRLSLVTCQIMVGSSQKLCLFFFSSLERKIQWLFLCLSFTFLNHLLSVYESKNKNSSNENVIDRKDGSVSWQNWSLKVQLITLGANREAWGPPASFRGKLWGFPGGLLPWGSSLCTGACERKLLTNPCSFPAFLPFPIFRNLGQDKELIVLLVQVPELN